MQLKSQQPCLFKYSTPHINGLQVGLPGPSDHPVGDGRAEKEAARNKHGMPTWSPSGNNLGMI